MTANIPENSEFTNIPYGKLGIIAMKGTEEIAAKIDKYIVQWRKENVHQVDLAGYVKDSYLIEYSAPRFSSGEAKAVLNQTVRGYDIFIIVDVFNYSVKYKMYGMQVPMSPDDHYSDIKRIISAIGGKAARVTVVMPMLYEGRQHRKTARESLDCAMAIQELIGLGVDSILTVDAHDPRVCNAIPFNGFENLSPIYQNIKALIKSNPDIRLDKDSIMVVSPDEGGMNRAMRYATALGVDLGMFYKRRDYTRIVDGRNPIIAHEFLGSNIEGKDVIVVDDMISSGESMLDVGKKLKALGAKNIYVFASFGLFTNGLEIFDEAYKLGNIKQIVCTNLIYRTPDLLSREWYVDVDMSKFLAFVIDAINHDVSIGPLLDSTTKINAILAKHDKDLAENGETQLSMENM
ncbi:MAG: ribose-phosphate pyrophosphokinase [Clostridia bacterium]|nr:ribose-phosphate pyrophosphokinase [Clostridia bacterium]